MQYNEIIETLETQGVIFLESTLFSISEQKYLNLLQLILKINNNLLIGLMKEKRMKC